MESKGLSVPLQHHCCSFVWACPKMSCLGLFAVLHSKCQWYHTLPSYQRRSTLKNSCISTGFVWFLSSGGARSSRACQTGDRSVTRVSSIRSSWDLRQSSTLFKSFVCPRQLKCGKKTSIIPHIFTHNLHLHLQLCRGHCHMLNYTAILWLCYARFLVSQLCWIAAL